MHMPPQVLADSLPVIRPLESLHTLRKPHLQVQGFKPASDVGSRNSHSIPRRLDLNAWCGICFRQVSLWFGLLRAPPARRVARVATLSLSPRKSHWSAAYQAHVSACQEMSGDSKPHETVAEPSNSRGTVNQLGRCPRGPEFGGSLADIMHVSCP